MTAKLPERVKGQLALAGVLRDGLTRSPRLWACPRCRARVVAFIDPVIANRVALVEAAPTTSVGELAVALVGLFCWELGAHEPAERTIPRHFHHSADEGCVYPPHVCEHRWPIHESASWFGAPSASRGRDDDPPF